MDSKWPFQAEGRVLRQAFRVVHVLVACQPAVDGLAKQTCQWQLRVPAARVDQRSLDQLRQETFLIVYAPLPIVGLDACPVRVIAIEGLSGY